MDGCGRQFFHQYTCLEYEMKSIVKHGQALRKLPIKDMQFFMAEVHVPGREVAVGKIARYLKLLRQLMECLSESFSGILRVECGRTSVSCPFKCLCCVPITMVIAVSLMERLPNLY